MAEATTSIRSALIVLRHTPYGRGPTRAAIDTALAYAAFEQPVTLLFMGEGVLQLHPDQQGRITGGRDIGKQLASLPLYGLEAIYVDAEAAERYGIALDGQPFACHPLSAAQMRALMDGFDHILGF